MKWLDLVMIIVGIISLAGSLFAMYVLAAVGDALNALSGIDASVLGITGVDTIVSTFRFFLTVGWVWVIMVFFTSLYAIYVGISRLRGKK